MMSDSFLKWTFISFLLIGCSSESNQLPDVPDNIASLKNLVVHHNTDDSDLITLDKEMTFAEADEVPWGRIIKELTVDKSGRVFIADMASNKIHVYEADGTYKVSLGSNGRGPGEFNTIWSLKTDDEYLHVFDRQHSKISLFDLESLNHVRDINLAMIQEENRQPNWMSKKKTKGFFYRITNFELYSEDQYLLIFSPIQPAETNAGQTIEISLFNWTDEEFTEHNLYSFKSEGTALYLDESDGGGVLSDVIFNPRAQIEYASEKMIYGSGEMMLFKVYDDLGMYRAAFYYPFENARINNQDLLAQYINPDENFKKILQKYAPETWPAYDNIVVDDQNRLWISTIINNYEIREWWVVDLNNDGRLIGKFKIPRSKNIVLVKNGSIFTIEQDIESGMREIAEYSFSFNKSS
jgi:hypothetical protein